MTPVEKSLREILERVLDPRGELRKSCLNFPLETYSRLYSIPLPTIVNIHNRYNPKLLDCPKALRRILVKQPGRKVNLKGIDQVLLTRFSSLLSTGTCAYCHHPTFEYPCSSCRKGPPK